MTEKEVNEILDKVFKEAERKMRIFIEACEKVGKMSDKQVEILSDTMEEAKLIKEEK